jgi:hypothetical protein
MGHHLPMIFSSRFGIENKNSMKIKSSLVEIVKFDRSREWDVGIIGPKALRWMKYFGWKLIMHILQWKIRIDVNNRDIEIMKRID